MDLADIVHSLDVTRARIEAEVAAPGVIAVTSAARGDGKSLVATGLAHGLAAVGHRVLLIDGNTDAVAANAGVSQSGSPVDPLAYVSAGLRGAPSHLNFSNPAFATSGSVETIQAAFALLREHFTYTVIDSGVLVESGLAVVFASESDGVVIAIKRGRGASDADREFVKVLRSSKTPILGVVTTRQKAIREFRSAMVSSGVPPSARLRADDTIKNAALGVRESRI